jgi:hypothetical protein
MSEWQDISTAPKDGKERMLLGDASSIGIGFWSVERGCWCFDPRPYEGMYDVPKMAEMTHWMPLPSRPAPSSAPNRAGPETEDAPAGPSGNP